MEYTLTIEQTGGSGITVPGRGFLLNNELTDFNLPTYDESEAPTASSPASGRAPRCRRRSCCATASRSWRSGSPGGSTIITTVLQMLFNRIDLGHDHPAGHRRAAGLPAQHRRSVARPSRRSSRPTRPASIALGHVLVPAGDAFTSAAEIGAATAIEFGPDGLLTAVSEPVRRGGGSALVVSPAP